MESDKRVRNLFFVGIIVSSVIISPYVVDFTLVSRFITLSLFLAAVFIVLFTKGKTLSLNANLPFTAYLLYTVFAGCSLLWANTTSEALFESCKQILGFSVFTFTLFSLKQDSSRFTKHILKFSVILFFIEFGIGIIQVTELDNFNKLSLYEITGINGHKNLFSSFLLLNLFFLILAAIKLTRPWKITAAVAMTLNLGFIMFLRTKAVWIGLSAAALTFVLIYASIQLRSKLKLHINIYVAIATAVILLNIFFIKMLPLIIAKGLHYNTEVQTLTKKNDQAELDDERLTLWEKTYVIFQKHPVKGVGMGNWQIAYPDAELTHLWRAEDLNYTFQRPHNDFLWILSETGLIGLNLFLLFVVSLLLWLMKAARAASEHNQLMYELILVASFVVAYLVTSFFDFPKERIEHSIWINILFGMAYFKISELIVIKSFFEMKPGRLFYLTSMGLLLFVSYVGILRYKGEFYLRNIYVAKGQTQYAEVIKLCRSAHSFAYTIDPTSIPLSWYSGNAKAATGDYAGAQNDFKNAYRLNPYNRNVLNDLASSYAFTNDMRAAKTYYKEAARISPRFDEPKLNLTAIYIRENNFKMAQYWLNSILHDSERRTNYQKIVDYNLQNSPVH